MNIFNLLKNFFIRIMEKKEVIIIATIIIPFMVAASSILFSQRSGVPIHVAYISDDVHVKLPETSKLDIDILPKQPERAELVLGNYDYVIEKTSNGDYKVSSELSNNKNIEYVKRFFTHPSFAENVVPQTNERDVGSSVLGVIIMVVFVQGAAIANLYPEDRESKTLKRIMTAPVTAGQYIFSQGTFTFVFLYVPTLVALAIAKLILGKQFGYSLSMLCFFLIILILLATTFSLFICSILRENISLFTSVISVITSLLGGCFAIVTPHNAVLKTICNIIPQTHFMNIVDGITQGKPLYHYAPQFMYISFWILVLGTISIFTINNTIKNAAI